MQIKTILKVSQMSRPLYRLLTKMCKLYYCMGQKSKTTQYSTQINNIHTLSGVSVTQSQKFNISEHQMLIIFENFNNCLEDYNARENTASLCPSIQKTYIDSILDDSILDEITNMAILVLQIYYFGILYQSSLAAKVGFACISNVIYFQILMISSAIIS